LVIWSPIPSAPALRCRTCGAKKEKFDIQKDELTFDDFGNVKGTWYCDNGHLNSERINE
jgi:hypothetical protein